MRKILPLLFFFTLLSVDAQITVSGSCNAFNQNPIGTYSISSGIFFNGREVYTIDNLTACGDITTASSCASGGGSGNSRFRIFWDGSQWVLEAVGCIWDSVLEACTQADYTLGYTLATNSADTPLPPNGDWVSNEAGCNFTISGGSLNLEDISNNNPKIFIHPNPSFEELTVEFPQPISNATLKITNIKGQTIFSTTIQSTNRETIKLNQSAGLYFLTLILNDGKQYNYKLIKN
ncbi:T9SS type A sorting domain-containing protein [Flavobacterium sp.]|uniref:T9SS type A sorting domain-containing protein n=1 Tax=Flavobacterium sp. TaxID=239 RepID=UPI004047A710